MPAGVARRRSFWTACCILVCAEAIGVQPITSIQAYYEDVDDSTYDFVSPGAGTASFPATNIYRTRFTVGPYNDLIITSFDVGTNNFIFRQLAERINIVRVDNPTVTGAHHILLYDRAGPIVNVTNINLASEYAATMEEILLATIINRGVDNVFCNTGNADGNNNNVERIDYIFGDGYPAYGNLRKKGFMVMDRGGNDALWVAAILALDTNGLPAAFSRPVLLAQTNWGNSGITLNTIVYRGYDGNYRPSANLGPQPLTGQYIEWEEFGIPTNALVYGYSLAAADISATQDWLQVWTFPLNTTESGNAGGLDLMSGGALILDERDNAMIGDRIWNDLNRNGLQDPGEPGLANVLVRVWDASGTNLAGQSRSDENGNYYVFALEPGVYQFEVVAPSNWLFSPRDVGYDDFLDSDIDPVTGRSGFFTLLPRTTNLQWDAGLYLPPTDVGISKLASGTDLRVGQQVVFSIAATNFGDYPAESLVIQDLIPTGLVYEGHFASLGTYDPTSGRWSVAILSTGSAASLVITARVSMTAAGWVITNIARVLSLYRPDTNPANDTAGATVTVRSLDIAVAKTVDNAIPDVGSLVTFSIVVSNAGPDSADALTVVDWLPEGLTFNNASASAGSYNATNGGWDVGSLPAGGVASLTLWARVNDDSAGLRLTNAAMALTYGLGDTNGANDSASVVLRVIGADLGVRKTADPAVINEGGLVSFRVVVTNEGPSATTGVSLWDALPSGLVYVAHSTSTGSYDPVGGVWTVGVLNAESTASLEITAQAPTSIVNRLVTNRAVILTSQAADGNRLNNTGEAVVAVSALRLSKSANPPSLVQPGEVIGYTIVVSNAGGAVHSNVALIDYLPTGVAYVAASSLIEGPVTLTNFVLETFNSVNYTSNYGNVNWRDPWFELGEAAQDPNAGSVRILTNALRISAANRGIERSVDLSGATNPVLSFLYRRAALDTSSDYVSVLVSSNGGETFVEIGRIAGPQNDTAFQPTNHPISAFASSNTVVRFFSSASLGAADYVHIDDVRIQWTASGTNVVEGGTPPQLLAGGTLAPGQSLRAFFSVRVEQPASITQIVNTAFATSSLQPLPLRASVTNTLEAADIALAKWTETSAPNIGDEVVFRVTATNGGPASPTNVVIGDQLPAGISFATATVTQGSFDPVAGNWILGPFPSGAVAELVLIGRVNFDASLPGRTLTNVAALIASSAADPNPLNNSATALVSVEAADLAVVKNVDIPFPLSGQTVTFGVMVSNAGPGSVDFITIRDEWPQGLAYESHTASQGSFSAENGIWDVGALPAGNTAILELRTVVTTSVVGIYLTNRAYVIASSRPDHQPLNDTGAVAVLTRATDPLAVQKFSGAGGTAEVPGQAPPGFTNTYTIIVTNPNSFAHTGIGVFDPVPGGAIYVASSTEITAPEYYTFEWFDNFQSRFYNNNYGNTNFLDDWSESEAANHPLSGNIQIAYDTTRGATYSLRFQGASALQWIRRSFNLTGFTNALLSFEYRRENLEAGDIAVFQISSNGYAGPWTTLIEFSGPANDEQYRTASFDIRPWISSNTAIRLAATNTALDTGDIVWLDDVRVIARKHTYLTRRGHVPPWLVTNLTLRPGDYARITFEVVVENPPSATQLVNTVAIRSDQQDAWVHAAVTDRVEFADTGLGKSVSDPRPDAGSVIEFTIWLTNYGPFAATDVTIEDLLPTGVAIVSNAPTAGSFDPNTRRWNVPLIATGAPAVLRLYARVEESLAGLTVTNAAFVRGQRQGDLNTTNNSALSSFTVVPPFIITDCLYNRTNAAVEIRHFAPDSRLLFDLLYADAAAFGTSLTNWALADRRPGGRLFDDGSLSGLHPSNLPPGVLRFYRVSAPGFWDTPPRRAGTQIKAFGMVVVYPGQNWVRVWGEPCENRIGAVLQDFLPAGESSIEAARAIWFNRAIHTNVTATQEVWLAAGPTNTWVCSLPRSLEGNLADHWTVPQTDGWCLDVPTNLPAGAVRIPMIFGVPTNPTVQIVPGGTNLSLVGIPVPASLHPSQLHLLEAGFRGAAVPVLSDMLWKFDRANQVVPNPGKIWFRTTDQSWRFDNAPTFSAVPTNYFKPDDAFVIRRVAPTPMIWTNRPPYPAPTRDMNP